MCREFVGRLPLPLGEGWGEGLATERSNHPSPFLFERTEEAKEENLLLQLLNYALTQPSPKGKWCLNLQNDCCGVSTESGSDRVTILEFSILAISGDPVATALGTDLILTLRPHPRFCKDRIIFHLAFPEMHCWENEKTIVYDPVASSTPSGLPAWGPRSARGSVTTVSSWPAAVPGPPSGGDGVSLVATTLVALAAQIPFFGAESITSPVTDKLETVTHILSRHGC